MNASQKTSEKKIEKGLPDRFKIKIDRDLCIKCKRCVKDCSFGALEFVDDRVHYKGGCVACGRCIAICPEDAISINVSTSQLPPHANFDDRTRHAIMSQASSGGVLLSSCGNDLPYESIFDDLLLDAAQVTNPSIDPLREPIETITYVGRRSGRMSVGNDGKIGPDSEGGPVVTMDMPMMLGQVSLGAVSYNAQKGYFAAAQQLNILAGSGEGGLHKDFFVYSDHINAEVASGRFGVNPAYLNKVASVEIKIGQGAKPGQGGHLPGEKVTLYDIPDKNDPAGHRCAVTISSS